MKRFLAWSLGACLAVIVASTTGCMSDCERVDSWAHGDSNVCHDCENAQCSREQSALNQVFLSCLRQYLDASNCPRNNRDHCACVDHAISSSPCRTAYFDLLACQARNCDQPCR